MSIRRHVLPIDYTAGSASLRTNEFLSVNQSCNKDWISSSCFYFSKLLLQVLFSLLEISSGSLT